MSKCVTRDQQAKSSNESLICSLERQKRLNIKKSFNERGRDRSDITRIDISLHRDRNHKIKIQLSAESGAHRLKISRSFSGYSLGRRLGKLHRLFTVSRMIVGKCRRVGMTGTICRCRSLRARFENKEKKIEGEAKKSTTRRRAKKTKNREYRIPKILKRHDGLISSTHATSSTHHVSR